MQQVFVLDANSVVCNFHPDKPTSSDTLAANMPIGLQTCRNRQSPRAVHRLIAILHQIKKNLREPIPIAANRRQTWIEAFFDINSWSGLRFQLQRENLFQNLVNVYWNDLQFCRSR